jgi:HD-GYP domain-containing protein (c-di-GMP phosphodiesterase class II)
MYVNRVIEQKRALKIKTKGMVKTEETIKSLAEKGILTLEIDLSKSQIESPISVEVEPPQEPSPSPLKPMQAKQLNGVQLNKANALYGDSKNVQKEFLEKIRTGQECDLQPLHDITLDIIDSLTENSGSLACLTLIKNADEYTLEHSLNCSILMSIFANYMKIDAYQVEDLCFASLLMDLGMTMMDQDTLHKTGALNSAEWGIIKSHVDIGIEITEHWGDVSDLVLDVISNHHEGVDGTGYPNGYSNEHISMFAKMAAIVDSYDAMTSERSYRKSMSPTTALKSLLADKRLDQQLVSQFIRCIGVHPVGSLVKLNSGKLAIVTKANAKEPLKPIVMSFYSIKSNHYNEIKTLDLSKIDDEIHSSIRPEEFKLNLPKFFQDVLLGAIK